MTYPYESRPRVTTYVYDIGNGTVRVYPLPESEEAPAPATEHPPIYLLDERGRLISVTDGTGRTVSFRDPGDAPSANGS